MTMKEKFLKQNVGFHFDDLSLMRQAELTAIATELGVSDDWILLALSKDSLESWEKWGFSLFRKNTFRAEIDNLLEIISRMDEKKFKQAAQKKTGKQVFISEKDFKRVWSGVKAQGRLYTVEEAEKLRLPCYWTYGYAVNPENYPEVNMMFATSSMPDEEEWCAYALAVQYVRAINE